MLKHLHVKNRLHALGSLGLGLQGLNAFRFWMVKFVV